MPCSTFIMGAIFCSTLTLSAVTYIGEFFELDNQILKREIASGISS